MSLSVSDVEYANLLALYGAAVIAAGGGGFKPSLADLRKWDADH